MPKLVILYGHPEDPAAFARWLNLPNHMGVGTVGQLRVMSAQHPT
jgi:hypothetical protein